MTRNKLRSDEWFDRRDEVGIRHRSALATLGLDPQFAAGHPIIGICNPVSEFNNCEIGLEDLIEPIKRGVAQAGGLALQRASIVATDGTVTDGPYPQTKELSGGFTIVDVPTREAALQWAAKIAVACRCAQEVREFGPDPELDAMLGAADS